MNLRLPGCIAVFWGITISLFAQQEITLEDIYKEGTFSPRWVSGIESMDDGKHFTRFEGPSGDRLVVKYRYADGKAVDTLLRQKSLKDSQGNTLRISGYEFSADESQMLLAAETEPIYRYSSRSYYYIYDLNSGDLQPLSDNNKGKQSLAEFSPDGSKVAFVRDNDLFYREINSGEETRVTDDGKWNHIINGSTDWVYEEEFAFDKGFYWSPNSEKLAYYRFDESEVKQFDMKFYGPLYPQEYKFKYPKAGETNSTVRIFVYDLDEKSARECPLNADPNQYIPRIKWTANQSELCVMRMNRPQTRLEFIAFDTSKDGDLTGENIYLEEEESYIEINDNLIFLPDGKHFLWNSERSGYNHIYLFNYEGEVVAPITSGEWDVIEFLGYDGDMKAVYFTAARENAIRKSVYRVEMDRLLKAGNKEKAAKKLKVEDLVEGEGYDNPTFSDGFKYFINRHSTANTPPTFTVRDSDGKELRVLEENTKLGAALENYNVPEKEFGKFTTGQGIELNYWIVRPPNMEEDREYPVLINVYGGPGKNTVLDQWQGSSDIWLRMLAQQGYVIVSVDPRGTQFRGREFKHSTYMELGKLETVDLIETAKWLKTKPYVDSTRIGVFGWSYGGYMTCLLLTKGAEHYSAGAAVAPVTNWRFYDTIYTERFMRTPQENASGYDENSPINHVEKLKGDLMIVHGSTDDNVHMQNTMEMVNALVEADKQFDLMLYPNRNHGIYGGNTRYHLFTRLTDFFKENL